MAGLLSFLGGGQAQLPATARQGAIMRGPDGFNYQYAQTSGMAGGGPSGQGWIRTNMPPNTSFLDRVLDPQVALPMAAQLMGQNGNMQNFGNAFAAAAPAFQQRAELKAQTAQKNQTLDFFRQKAPEYYEMVQAGMPVKDAWTQYVQSRQAQKPTDDIREYEFAKSQGYDGTFRDYMLEGRKAGATTVNVGGDNAPGLGKLSTDYGYKLHPETRQPVIGPDGLPVAAPIPGSPAYLEQQKSAEQSVARQGAASTASEVVTTAAQRAREAVGNQNFGSAGTTAVANIPILGPMTDSAEVVRNTDVLKNMAAAENLNAMRQMSPTGGALGNVTEKELKLLQDKSGALDPNSPTFLRDLEDYERTLLRTIHGKEAGDQIFESTRSPNAAGGNADPLGIR